LSKDAEYRQFCSDSLAGAGRSTKQDVAVGVVEWVEDLRLDWIEVSEAVQ